jgi:hypothetical protein
VHGRRNDDVFNVNHLRSSGDGTVETLNAFKGNHKASTRADHVTLLSEKTYLTPWTSSLDKERYPLAILPKEIACITTNVKLSERIAGLNCMRLGA